MENQDIQKAAETISDIEQTTDFETPVADTEKLETRDELTPAQASKLLQQTKTLMDCITPEVEKRLVEQGEYIDRSVVNAAMSDFAKIAGQQVVRDTEGNVVDTLPLDAQPVKPLNITQADNHPCIEGCSCDTDDLLETGADGMQMLFEMVEELKLQISSLEGRIAAHNLKASHKI